MKHYILLDGSKMGDLNSLFDYLSDSIDKFQSHNPELNNSKDKVRIDNLSIALFSDVDREAMLSGLDKDRFDDLRYSVQNGKALIMCMDCDDKKVNVRDVCIKWAEHINSHDLTIASAKDNLNYALAIYNSCIDNDIDLPDRTTVKETVEMDGNVMYGSVYYIYDGKINYNYNVSFQDYALCPREDESVLSMFLEKVYNQSVGEIDKEK